MPRLRSQLGLVLVSLVLGACVDPHWDAVRWPAQGPESIPQPRASSPGAGVELEALAMTWDSQTISIELELRNTAETALLVDSSAILVAWDGLEYPPASESDAAEATTTMTIEPEASIVIDLRYQLGRPLSSRGARLVLRSLEREGAPLTTVPELDLPSSE